jgi:Sulfatase-modifying factor enzyme 1
MSVQINAEIYMQINNIWTNFVHFVTTLGSNGLVDLIAGVVLTIVVSSARKIGYLLSKLLKLITTIIRKDKKYYNFEQAYLSWIINRNRYLGLLPARTVAARWGEGRRNVDLEKAYITLQISTQKEDLNKGKASSDDDVLQSWFSPRLNVHHLQASDEFGIPSLGIDKNKYFVIRGDPGSGKTTLLRYLAVTCARALRDDKQQGDSSDLVRKRLEWNVNPFPIVVTLRRHNDVNSWGKEKNLINIFLEEMPVELRNRYPEGFFESKIIKGNCLILLDAFDELGSVETRAAMGRRIGDFLDIYNQSNNRILVTTRIVGYEGQLDIYDFHIRTIQRLDTREIRSLVKQRYQAIALSETYGWRPHDAAPILQDMRQLAERLIKKIETTPRLSQLATNPLLLSLIVLIHYVKLELPQERVLLYRDCVEILTEQWQRSKLAAIDITLEAQEELTLPQKLSILQEIALYMQQKREDKDRQTLLPQLEVQEIIAHKLSDILGNQLPKAKSERLLICKRKAGAWMASIQVDSGILVEQGLDEEGNPLIGFSHLTFQEYLAAVAINEAPQYQQLIKDNLSQPMWSEVILLYVALTNDATETILSLLNMHAQPMGILLAGICLAERVRRIKGEAYQLVIDKLKEGFQQNNAQTVASFGQVLSTIGGNEVTAFMRQQLQSQIAEQRLEAIKALGRTKLNDVHIKDIREDLVNFVETPNDITLVIAAREALAQIGDPRFIGKEPILRLVSFHSNSIPLSPKSWKELVSSLEWTNSRKIWEKFSLMARVFDYWLFNNFHPLSKKSHQKSFEIGKYLITNIEYARFISATGYRFREGIDHLPLYWIEGTFPLEKSTHPVVGITVKDAIEYCKWLSRETGKVYRLPTEWEWEWAATGLLSSQFSWGDQFDKSKCNTAEGNIRGTTPVGSYLMGTNLYGLTDMNGNVWDITRGYKFAWLFSLWTLLLAFLFTLSLFFTKIHVEINLVNFLLSLFIGPIESIMLLISSVSIFNNSYIKKAIFNIKNLLLYEVLVAIFFIFNFKIGDSLLEIVMFLMSGLFLFLLALLGKSSWASPIVISTLNSVSIVILSAVLYLLKFEEFTSTVMITVLILTSSTILLIIMAKAIGFIPLGISQFVLRGGGFDTPSYEATCFFRKAYIFDGTNPEVGFRCVREL